MGLSGLVVWQSGQPVGVNRNSLFYELISGEEVLEGPLDPTAYASGDSAGTGGPRLAAASASDVNLITFDDPEVSFAETLAGNAVVGPLQPIVPETETGEEAGKETSPAGKKPFIHTVVEGDTVTSIAAEHGISENTVLWANGLSSRNILKVGDHLTILPTTGVLHTVQSGDTVLGIAQKYDVKGKDVAEYNNLTDSSRLSIGQKLIIPDGYIAPVSTAPRVASSNERIAREDTSGPTPPPSGEAAASAGFAWPTTTRHISQYFGWGHTGLDIDNRARPPVFAAQSGTVEFAGWLGGYGNLLIINHGGGLTTYYAHNDKFYVGKGQQVAKGAAIAKMGSTGRSTGPHVHFEVRKSGRPINPLSMY